ncbi:MAG TPA: LptF/LptG family permease [Gemmatimonadaceae bacterium]|nr:LptF/LptG family permease [Gemmatimonadaceae bacterium]
MKILHKYVLKEHLGPLVFALTALTSLLLLQYIAKRFGELVGKGLPWSVIAEFLGLSVPLTVALSLPMAVLVSTLYAFSRLAAENEITAMKASGVSLRNVLTPVLFAAIGVTLFMVGFNDQVLPRANHKLRTLQGDIAQKKPTFGLREQVINEVSPGKLYLRTGHLSQTTNLMREVTIYDVGDATRRRTIYADSGNMAMSPDQADLQLTLYSGTVQDVPTATPEQLQRLYFKTQLIRVRGVGNEFRKTTNDTFKGEREMSVCEMEQNADKARTSFTDAREEFIRKVRLARSRKVKLSEDALGTSTSSPLSIGLGHAYCAVLAKVGVKQVMAQTPLPPSVGGPAPTLEGEHLPGTVRIDPASVAAADNALPNDVIPAQVESARLRLTDSERSINLYEVEIHKKFALAAACFVFVLLGAPIALRFPRGGVGLTIGVSLVVFALYYVGLIAGESLARRGMVPPFLSMWLTNFLFAILALVMLAKMGKESGSNRGDMREVLDNIRHRVRRVFGRSSRRTSPRPAAS